MTNSAADVPATTDFASVVGVFHDCSLVRDVEKHVQQAVHDERCCDVFDCFHLASLDVGECECDAGVTELLHLRVEPDAFRAVEYGDVDFASCCIG